VTQPAVATTVRIGLLGRFWVAVGDVEVPEEAWRRSKAAAVVKLLALAPAHRLHREQVMDVLWPTLGPAAAAANLRKAVHYARRALDAGCSGVIVSSGDILSLPTEQVVIDVEVWRVTAARARRAGDSDLYAEAVALYGDGLLPDDRYEEWTVSARDELQAELVALLEEQARLLEARGGIDGALGAGR